MQRRQTKRELQIAGVRETLQPRVRERCGQRGGSQTGQPSPASAREGRCGSLGAMGTFFLGIVLLARDIQRAPIPPQPGGNTRRWIPALGRPCTQQGLLCTVMR